jgi:excisionase family DNA binding protein
MATVGLYSTDDVADMLGLHVRTVRNYVRDGRLPAVRIGKQYRIAAEDVDELTGGRATSPPATSAPVPRRVEVTAVVQVDGIDEQTMTRLSALVTGAVSSRPGGAARLHVETVYDQQRRTVKIVAIGSADDTATLLHVVGTFAEAGL